MANVNKINIRGTVYDIEDEQARLALQGKQPKTLETPVVIDGQSRTTVENALQAIATQLSEQNESIEKLLAIGDYLTISGQNVQCEPSQSAQAGTITLPAGTYLILGYAACNTAFDSYYILYFQGDVTRIGGNQIRQSGIGGGGIVNSALAVSTGDQNIILSVYNPPDVARVYSFVLTAIRIK